VSYLLYSCLNKATCAAEQGEVLVLRVQLLQVGHVYSGAKVQIYKWIALKVDALQMQILEVSIARAIHQAVGVVQMAD
jgi:hypothetical protein